MPSAEFYMNRCLQLARLGAGDVAPNPMVGAVLVYNDTIIGEGYHRQYGGPHAEPDCINNVKERDRSLVAGSTLFVSLEPCAHFGKTPPCADLVIRHNIKKVVVGCRDPFPEVNGKGIEKLRAAGIEVITGVLEDACKALNASFFTFHTQKRPYIILKWAKSADGFVGAAVQPSASDRVLISNDITNRLVHKWRAEAAGILIGTETALLDDPALTVRLWKGKNPTRLVIDRSLRLPHTLKVFDKTVPTIIFNDALSSTENNLEHYNLEGALNYPKALCDVLYARGINEILIEGGPRLLQSFIQESLWDEARIITNKNLLLYRGVKAPALNAGRVIKSDEYLDDEVMVVRRLIG